MLGLGRPEHASLPELVAAAEAALAADDLPTARSCLHTYFLEADRCCQGAGQQQALLTGKAAAADQAMVAACFAAGQLASRLTSAAKGQALVDGTEEALSHIMRGVKLAEANPRHAHLIYNGSVHFWHAARPLHQLRAHLLPHQERLCQALEKVEGQPAWRARNLGSLALCQLDVGRADEAGKTLAKALELASSAGVVQLRHELAALQVHMQTVQAARAAPAKPGAAAAKAAGPPGAAAAAAAAAAAGAKPGAAVKGKKGDQATGAAKLDEDSARALVQWVLSSKPDAAAAEQQLTAAWKLVDPAPEQPSRSALLHVVARIGWAAAVVGLRPLAEQCARRAAASPDLSPRLWSDLTRLALALAAAPPAALSPAACSAGSGASVCAAGVSARREVLDGADDALAGLLRLRDVEGVHAAALLAWNAGLPLLQPAHRALIKPAFTAAAKALEVVGSPLGCLRAALHLEVAKAEADSDSVVKAAREVSLALAINYPPSAEAAAAWGYERPLDRFLEPLARAARVRGALALPYAEAAAGEAGPARAQQQAAEEDAAVLLLERARDSKSAAVRAEHLQKAINKLALLPPVSPPSAAPAGAGGTPAADSAGGADAAALAGDAARQQQLRAARARMQLWAQIVDAAWFPCKLEGLVRAAAPSALAVDWQATGDAEVLLLQARVALLEADACRAALKARSQELLPPAGHSAAAPAGSAAAAPGAAATSGGVRLPSTTSDQLQRLFVDDALAAVRLAVHARSAAWLSGNAAAAVWNAYLPVLQRERHAELAGVLLPTLSALLQDAGSLDPALIVQLAEAAAKAAEHVALLHVLAPGSGAQAARPASVGAAVAANEAAAAGGSSSSDRDREEAFLHFRAAATPWFVSLSDARDATAELDLPTLLQAGVGSAAVLRLLADTTDACQAALVRAAAAAEPQGLIQGLARLQQLQGLPIALPAGAPAAMADTSKVLALIEGLSAAPSSASPAAKAPGAASSAGGRPAPSVKGTAAAPAVGKAEQIRAAMSLLSAMPAVNLQLWSQLARAAGRAGCWLLARECADAALGALPAGSRDLTTVAAAADVPSVTPQGWHWLAVAELQQGQALLSLLPAAAHEGAASRLALHHAALQRFATAAKLAAFVRRADLAEAAARLAHNAASALLDHGLTRAAALPALRTVAAALNTCRPADAEFQVHVNSLLLDCLAAAGRWSEARRAAESMQRCLPAKLAATHPAAAARVAGWRAACLVHAAPAGRAGEGMNRLLAELSAPTAKAHAWLCFAQASHSTAEQLAARQSALASLSSLPAEAKVEHLLEFASWLAASGCPADAVAAGLTPEALLLEAAAALQELQAAAGQDGPPAAATADGASVAPHPHAASCQRSGSPASAASAGSDCKAPVLGAHAARPRSPCAPSAAAPVWSPRHMEQLLRARLALSQVAAAAADRQHHLLLAQRCAVDMLHTSLAAAGAASAASALGTPEPAGTAPADSSAQASGAAVAPPPAAQGGQPVVKAGAAAAAPAAAAQNSVGASRLIPDKLLAWASWVPEPGLLQQLVDQASHGAAASGASPTSLSRACMLAPELLLAALELLACELQAGGHHARSLPVLHLGRLVAAVTLASEGMASAFGLQLSAACEALGLAGQAACWLELAAPDSWPSQAELHEVAQSLAVQRLAAAALQQHAAGNAAAAAVDGAQPPAPLHAALLHAAQEVEPAVLQAWLSSSAGGGGSNGGTSSSSSDPSTCQERPSSAAGSGAAAATAAAAAPSTAAGRAAATVPQQRMLRPLAPHDAWLCMARLLTDRAQYTPAQRLCAAALELARSHQDADAEAAALLLQARLALLAQHPAAAVGLVQAAQALGGGLGLWRDSVEAYADARGSMPGNGPADALAALEGGVALMETLARGSPVFQPRVLGACGALRLRLSKCMAAEARKLLGSGDGREHADAAGAPGLQSRALELAQAAAQELQQAGAALDRLRALQAASLLLCERAAALGVPDQRAALLEAMRLLQVAEGEAESLATCSGGGGDASSLPATQLSTPASRALAAIQLQLAGVELQLGQLRLAHTLPGQAAAVPDFPRMQGRDPQPVLAYLAAAAAAADAGKAGAGCSGASSSGLSQAALCAAALRHAEAAAAATLQQPAAHAAALLAIGRACLQQAHAALPDSKEPQQQAAGVASSEAEAGSDAQLPVAAQELHARGVEQLQQALDQALACQALDIARAAALELTRCLGERQPASAAAALAAAQSCTSAVAMREAFVQCAAEQHSEVLLWRQLQQLQGLHQGAGTAPQLQQVTQMLSLLGVTDARLHVGPLPSLVQPLATLQPDQRVLLLHHDAARQELLVAAWNVPLPAGASNGGIAAADATAPAAPAPAVPAAVSGSGSGGAQPKPPGGRRPSAKGLATGRPASASLAAPAAAAGPRGVLLGRAPLSSERLDSLTAGITQYQRRLAQQIAAVTGHPPPPPPPPPAEEAAAAAAAAAAVAAHAPKKAAPAGKSPAAGKDRAGKDGGGSAAEAPAWLPPAPVFEPWVNPQWRELVQQLEGVLSPVAELLLQALLPGMPASCGMQQPQPQAQPQPAPRLSLQLLLDPAMCALPWEALPAVRRSCGSVARCFSLAQLAQLLAPPLLQQQQPQQQDAAPGAMEPAAAPCLDVRGLSYLVDPLHQTSRALQPHERPGCYAPPLLPQFRQHVQDVWGAEWQGLAGTPGQLPSSEQLARPLLGARGLLVLCPGRLLDVVPPQAIAGTDLSSCTAAVVLDRLPCDAAATAQLHAASRQAAARSPCQDSPAHAALLLMLRGARAVVVASACGGTPHSHTQLAAQLLRGMVAGPAPGPGGPLSLGEAAWAAQQALAGAGFELQAVCEAGLQVYGLPSVVAADGGGGARGAGRSKKGPAA